MSDLIAPLHLTVALIDRVRNSFRTKTPDLAPLILLFDTEILDDVDPRTIDLDTRRIIAPNANTLIVEFVADNVTRGTQAYQVYSFKYWRERLDVSQQYEYNGHRFLVPHTTNNCIKVIEEQIAQEVALRVQCGERDYEDKHLAKWKTLSHNCGRKIHTHLSTT